MPHTIVSCGTVIPSLRTETHFQHFTAGDSPTVAGIRGLPNNMIRANIIRLIREKARLISIRSPVHRRKIKRPNRPKCGHDLRPDRVVACETKKNPCFWRKGMTIQSYPNGEDAEGIFDSPAGACLRWTPKEISGVGI